MSFEDCSPSDPLLSLLQFNYHFVSSSLALLNVPTALLRIYDALEIVGEVGWSVFESYCEVFRGDGDFEDGGRFDIGG